MRTNRITPHVAGLPCRNAISPKSLSKVTNTRLWGEGSGKHGVVAGPGDSSTIQCQIMTGLPGRPATTSPGTFSFARKPGHLHTGKG